MTDDFQQFLAKVQSLQRRYTCDMNSFAVVVKYDDYYEEYLEVDIRTDNGNFFLTTFSCVYEDEYEVKLKELKRIIEEILNETEDE